ncbi:MAG: hypothetical protein J5I62_05415 [Flavobacteriales bacterium]|nr:hypothetical protein [Flavobacteriales bacterium]MEB2342784.1 hypothetical protein [Flavobacteriia bacterium]
MDSAARKWSITEQLALISDDSVLEQIQRFIAKKLRGVAEAEISDEEIAEFDRHHAAYMRGDLKGISGKESVKRLRKAQVRDEAL